ncbi:PREDICTED: modifier of mdg4 [Rhagoletis zephyria]|uniref:modifier of mdg4 n=1 Tax=Rhagoletis zephyria TaxID=28612 RepID=UPI0008119D7F|nr:PREDICTED: modifier of mdg4 [Rhagoletis zephyria]
MNHLKWMGHSATIFDIQRNLRNDPQSCEVTLVAKGHSVRAHRFVLSSCSDLLRNLLVDIPMGQEATIVVPDIKGSLLESVLAFIYVGETSLTSTNLSEFLEAINTLGIKSAISFECNNATLSTAVPATIPVKTITNIEIAQEELIEQQENIAVEKIETQNVIQHERELEFLDVYNDAQHSKITYSIEHMPVASTANEYILTENSGTFTLTQNNKLENASNSDSEKLVEMEDTTEDAHIIEEYSSNSADPIIEIAANTATSTTPKATATLTNSQVPQPLIQIKSTPKIKTIKIKSQTNTETDQIHQSLYTAIDPTADPISVLKTEDTYASLNSAPGAPEDGLFYAVQAVINEGMSLQKAAQKYDLSKTVLWRRVRKHPNYMKTARENPVLTMAYERLKGGDSLKNISRELDIPMSTLHRHKVRLAQQGRLPDYVSFKKRDVNSKIELKDKLTKALHACVHEGMSQNHAANLFDIPKSTLWRHLQKRVAEAELSQKLEQGHIKEEVILS